MVKIARRDRDRREHASRKRQSILSSTLEQLEGVEWGEATFGSHLVIACHALRRKPLSSLTDEELRMAIGQGIGLEWLVPLAIERLWDDPLRSGDFYEGDLLQNVLKIEKDFWTDHQPEAEQLQKIVEVILDGENSTQLVKSVLDAAARFREANSGTQSA